MRICNLHEILLGNTRNDKKNSKRMNKKGKETNKHSSRIKGVQKYSIKQAHSKINSTQSIVDDNVRKLLLLSSGKSDMKKVEKVTSKCDFHHYTNTNGCLISFLR